MDEQLRVGYGKTDLEFERGGGRGGLLVNAGINNPKLNLYLL